VDKDQSSLDLGVVPVGLCHGKRDAAKSRSHNDQLSNILAELLTNNSLSKIKRTAFERDGTKQAIIDKPWGDALLAMVRRVNRGDAMRRERFWSAT